MPITHATGPNGDLYLGGSFTTHSSPVVERSPGIVRRAASVCPPSLASQGSGCVGISPTLEVFSRAYLGQTFASRCTVSSQTIAFWILSTSPASTLLSGLHPAGQAGCLSLVGLDQIVLLALPEWGVVSGQTALPHDPRLLGMPLHNQILGLDVDATGTLIRLYSSSAIVTAPSTF